MFFLENDGGYWQFLFEVAEGLNEVLITFQNSPRSIELLR